MLTNGVHYNVVYLSEFRIEGGRSAGAYMACGATLACTFELGLFQDYRGSQQNPNQAEYQEREQGHQEYRHSCTSLLHDSLSQCCGKL
jgi:hypothetical protein